MTMLVHVSTFIAGCLTLSFFVVPNAICLSLCTVERELKNAGFHRGFANDVRIAVNRSSLGANIECGIMIKEKIPSGMYVDLFEVQRYSERTGVDIHSLTDIDTEKFEHLSAPHDIYMFSDLSPGTDTHQAYIELPVHLRYHKSAKSWHEAKVTIGRPEVFYRCSDKHETKSTIEYMCSPRTNQLCTWNRLECKVNPTEFVVFVPVGNLDHSVLVVVVTIATTVLATVYLAYRVLIKDEGVSKHD